MSQILGLLSTESVSGQRPKSIRRKVFHSYPTGAFPITGLLSLLDGEEASDQKFGWWEKRFVPKTTTTASQGSSKGPFKTAADSDLGDPAQLVAGTEYIVVVADSSKFEVAHQICIRNLNMHTATGLIDVTGVVTALPSATKIKFRANLARSTATNTDLKNGADDENVGKSVSYIGSAYAEGRSNVSGGITILPTYCENYIGTHRTSFLITDPALATTLNYDKTGAYREQAKDNSVQHMVGLEMCLIYGERSYHYSAATPVPATGVGLPTYTTGGIPWFLQQWDRGNTSNTPAGAFDYRTGSAATADTDDNKRIIVNSSGTISRSQLEGYYERIFRVSNNKSNEKIGVCGSGALAVLNQLYCGSANLTMGVPAAGTFGSDLIAHRTPFGMVYYKTHPLFSADPDLRFAMLLIDPGNMSWRALRGRDTQLFKDRGERDGLYRKDEWISMFGLELRFPETFMFIQNVRSWVP